MFTNRNMSKNRHFSKVFFGIFFAALTIAALFYYPNSKPDTGKKS